MDLHNWGSRVSLVLFCTGIILVAFGETVWGIGASIAGGVLEGSLQTFRGQTAGLTATALRAMTDGIVGAMILAVAAILITTHATTIETLRPAYALIAFQLPCSLILLARITTHMAFVDAGIRQERGERN